MTTQKKKTRYSENKSNSHFVHYKFHRNCSVIEPTRGRRLTTWYMAHRLDQCTFCNHGAVVEAISAFPFQQPLRADFAVRLFTKSQCSLHCSFYN